MTMIRPRKDGNGYSECSSPDDKVGKGRCVHILSVGPTMELTKIQRGTYEVKVCESSLTIQAQKESIIDFFNKIPKIDEAQQKKIIDFLKEN